MVSFTSILALTAGVSAAAVTYSGTTSSAEASYVCDGAVCTTVETNSPATSASSSSAKPSLVCDGAVCSSATVISTSSAKPSYVCDGAVCSSLSPTSTTPTASSSSSFVSQPSSTSVSCTVQYNNCPASGLTLDQCNSQLAACRSRCEQTLNYCQVDNPATECTNAYNQCLGTGPVLPYSSIISSSGVASKTGSVSVSSTKASGTVGSTSTASVVSCAAKYAACVISEPPPAPGVCSSALTDCQNTCAAQRTTCELVPNSNKSQCAAIYAECTGSLSTSSSARSGSARSSSTTSSVASSVSSSCAAQKTACELAPNSNKSQCESTYTQCIASSNVTTTVVTAFTTVCPSPTTLTYNGQTYTVTSSSTLTITNCPCTIKTSISTPASTVVTTVVPVITTVCPTPTTVTIQSSTITVSSSTTITVACPGGCTVTSTLSSGPSGTGYFPSIMTPQSSPVWQSGSPTTSAPATYSGAADKLSEQAALMVGAGVIALFAL